MNRCADVIERLEKAAGPDRAIDAFVSVAAGEADTGAETYGPHLWRTRVALRAKPYTSSIDEAVALIERKLPGWDLQLFNRPKKGCWMARIKSPHYELFCTKLIEGEEQRVSSAPIAILLALFRALDYIAKAPSGDD